MGTKLKYKIGDKVRIIKFIHKDKIGKIGVIIKNYLMEYPETKFPYRIKVGNWDCPMMESELEPVLKIGEQLLLFEL